MKHSSFFIFVTSLLASTAFAVVSNLSTSLSESWASQSSSGVSTFDAPYFLSTVTITDKITWELIVSKTVTYENHDDDVPTLTLTGPITSTETKTITTIIIAKNNQLDPTPISFPNWDRAHFEDYLDGSIPSDEAAASAISSFISFGRQPACTSAYYAFEATAATTTRNHPQRILTTTAPNGEVTETIIFDTVTEVIGANDSPCCRGCS